MPDKCRSCGAEVLFVPSAKAGALMILDAHPVPNGNIVIQSGQAVVVKKDLLPLTAGFGEPLYRDHHATCPQAKQWRKSKVKDS